jgi:hypothetical protein
LASNDGLCERFGPQRVCGPKEAHGASAEAVLKGGAGGGNLNLSGFPSLACTTATHSPLAPRKPPQIPGISSRRTPNPPLQTNKEAKHQQSAGDTSTVEGLAGALARTGVPAPGRACLFVISERRIGAVWVRQHEQIRAGTHPNKARVHRGPTNPSGKGRDVRGTVRRPSGSLPKQHLYSTIE